MAPPTLGQSTRYIDPGVTKCYFVPAIANINSPTRAELDAGTDLSPEIAASAGWSVAAAEVETPDLGRTFTSKIPGKTNAEDSSITFYMSTQTGGAAVLDLLPRGTAGHICWLHGGDVQNNPMDVYPVRVRAQPKVMDASGAAASQVRVDFSITSQPSENVNVPAAA